MRVGVVVAVGFATLHAARPPDVVLMPDVAQDLWPVPELHAPVADLTLVEGTVMDGWEPVPTVVTAEEVRTDRFLWRRMFFRNWDRIGLPLRDEGLEAMLARYRPALRGPARWDAMDAEDWDRVPQPIRAMAVLGMIDCWREHYRVGERPGLDPRAASDRMQAIAMSESWFQHRAVSENDDGGRDVGIAQASEATRSRIRVLFVRGDADFGLADEEHFDPWKSTRALVFWFSLLLDEASGDLDLATRAYNVGAEAARRGGGRRYLEGVRRREAEYVRGASPSPSWRHLRERCPSPCPAGDGVPDPAAPPAR